MLSQKIKITKQTLLKSFLFLVLFETWSIVFLGYWSHFSIKDPLSLLALILYICSFWSPLLGLGLLTFSISIAPTLFAQLSEILKVDFGIAGPFSVILSASFSLACFLRIGWKKMDDFMRSKAAPYFLGFCGFILVSVSLSILRNLWQSASPFSWRGLFFNLILWEQLDWHFDYFPLRDLLAYGIAATLFVSSFTISKEYRKAALLSTAAGFFGGALCNITLALVQWKYNIGWTRDVFWVGVSGFWPDVHAFGGYISVVLFIAYGLLRSTQSKLLNSLLLGMFLVLSATCVYLSGSRSTILMTVMLLLCCEFYFLFHLGKERRLIALSFIAVILLATGSALYTGVRGFSFESFHELWRNTDFEAFNLKLSYRPEIFVSAVRMYKEFPLMGVGQGSFYRLSAIPGFSTSEFLLSSGGENAHSYFLQSFVEWGPIGAVLAIILLCYCIRMSWNRIGIFIFLGILAGNLFTHSLLVRELLFLTAILFGVSMGSFHDLNDIPGTKSKFRLIAVVVIIALIPFAILETVESFGKSPFLYGKRCYESHSLYPDGWTSGLFIAPVKDHVELRLIPGEIAYKAPPLTADVKIADEEGDNLVHEIYEISDSAGRGQTRDISLSAVGAKDLRVQLSRCLVPLNAGINLDSRHLGIRIESFRTND